MPNGGFEISGKRIICCNRYGKSGCGHTRQLYLQNIIPKRQYTLTVVIAFIKTLLSNAHIEEAYIQSTGKITEARHAWRWIKDLFKKLPRWRALIPRSTEKSKHSYSPERLNILLSTLKQLLGTFSAASLQHKLECAFF
jgi:hypothetical protein